MKPRELCNKLNSFFEDGYSKGIFLAVQHHVLDGPAGNEALGPTTTLGMYADGGLSLEEYSALVDSGRYSAIFSDHALITVECLFSSGSLIKHRYGYIPCPVHKELMEERPLEIPIADWVREAASGQGGDVFRSLGIYRFDYAPKQAGDRHSASHLTFVSKECRIPVRSALDVSGFLNFIFDNFYARHIPWWLGYAPFLTSETVEDTIEYDEMIRHHISWADVY